ncbi:MAG: LysR family transcriptional regulator [Woeseiaceae bacterium]|nr:LysR family transcriptional regulator [Woeseiaceae bacterium]
MVNERDIQLGSLRIFAAVAESETLTSAAQKLGVTQSAVSQAIAQLESLTGTELVVRRARPVRLTPAGNVLRDHANKILAEVREMLRDVSTAAAGDLPRLTVGVIDSFADVAGQRLTEMIAPIAPQLSLQTGLTMPLSEALLSRNIDVLITSDPLQEHAEFECLPLLRDPFVMIVSESLCDNDEVTAESLARKIPFARYTRETRLGKMTDLVLRRAGIDPPPRFEFDSTHSLMRAVHAGQAWAIATSLCVMQYPSLLNNVRTLPVANGASSRYVCLLARRGELGDTAIRIAEICRDIHTGHILPKILELMPWLEGQAVAITEAPQIWSA